MNGSCERTIVRCIYHYHRCTDAWATKCDKRIYRIAFVPTNVKRVSVRLRAYEVTGDENEKRVDVSCAIVTMTTESNG